MCVARCEGAIKSQKMLQKSNILCLALQGASFSLSTKYEEILSFVYPLSFLSATWRYDFPCLTLMWNNREHLFSFLILIPWCSFLYQFYVCNILNLILKYIDLFYSILYTCIWNHGNKLVLLKLQLIYRLYVENNNRWTLFYSYCFVNWIQHAIHNFFYSKKSVKCMVNSNVFCFFILPYIWIFIRFYIWNLQFPFHFNQRTPLIKR